MRWFDLIEGHDKCPQIQLLLREEAYGFGLSFCLALPYDAAKSFLPTPSVGRAVSASQCHYSSSVKYIGHSEAEVNGRFRIKVFVYP